MTYSTITDADLDAMRARCDAVRGMLIGVDVDVTGVSPGGGFAEGWLDFALAARTDLPRLINALVLERDRQHAATIDVLKQTRADNAKLRAALELIASEPCGPATHALENCGSCVTCLARGALEK